MDVHTALRLIDQKADVNERHQPGEVTPLHVQCMYYATNIKVVQLLLDHKADPNAMNSHHKTPLHRAVGQGDGVAVAALVGAKADPNASVGSHVSPFGALFQANLSESHRLSVLSLLLVQRADPFQGMPVGMDSILKLQNLKSQSRSGVYRLCLGALISERRRLAGCAFLNPSPRSVLTRAKTRSLYEPWLLIGVLQYSSLCPVARKKRQRTVKPE
jgi:hypothetical protein